MLFFYCLIILFPAIREIILKSKSNDKISKLIAKIDVNAINEIGYDRPRVSMQRQMEVIENNPLFILSDVCIRSINDEDRLTPRLIISESTSKLLELLKGSDGGQIARNYINSFFIIFKIAFEKASSLRQNGTLITILYAVEQIYHTCAENKFKWYSMIELNEELERIAIVLVESNNNDLAKRAIWLLERVYLEQVKNNLPEESEIWELNFDDKKRENDDIEKANQWSEINYKLLYDLNNIIEHAFECKRTEVIWHGLRAFTSIATEICSYRLGDRMKLTIIQNCLYFAKNLTIESSELNLIKRSSLMIPFNALSMDRILEPSKEYSKSALLYFGSTFIELAKRDQLTSFSLNEIGATGRFCMREIEKSDFLKESTIYLTNVLISIFEIYRNSSNQDKDQFLLEAYNQAESIRKWFKGDPSNYEELLRNLDEKLSKINKPSHLISKQNDTFKWYEIN